jgi:hypothetical protein
MTKVNGIRSWFERLRLLELDHGLNDQG